MLVFMQWRNQLLIAINRSLTMLLPLQSRHDYFAFLFSVYLLVHHLILPLRPHLLPLLFIKMKSQL